MRTFAALAAPLSVTLALVLAPVTALAQDTKPLHGVAMHGTPKYGPNFKHFDYTDPNAPKGGAIRISSIGTFDNFKLRTSMCVACSDTLPTPTFTTANCANPHVQMANSTVTPQFKHATAQSDATQQ